MFENKKKKTHERAEYMMDGEMLQAKKELNSYFTNSIDDLHWLSLFDGINCRMSHNVDMSHMPQEFEKRNTNFATFKHKLIDFGEYVNERCNFMIARNDDAMKLSHGLMLS